jgi:hypothetical protein
MLQEQEGNGWNVSAALLGIKNPGYSLPPSTPTRHSSIFYSFFLHPSIPITNNQLRIFGSKRRTHLVEFVSCEIPHTIIKSEPMHLPPCKARHCNATESIFNKKSVQYICGIFIKWNSSVLDNWPLPPWVVVLVTAINFERKREEYVSKDKIGLIYSVYRWLMRKFSLTVIFFTDFFYYY